MDKKVQKRTRPVVEKSNETKKSKTDIEIEKIGKISRKEYERLKRRSIKFEAQNLKYILVIPCDGDSGWCEMGERSALLYKYEVCEKLGAPVNMDNDADSYYTQYVLGRIRTKGFDTVRKRIQKLGLYAKEIERDKCIIFCLKKEYSPDEMKNLEDLEQRRQNRINSIIKVDYVDPVLYRDVATLMRRMHKMMLKEMDKISQAVVGQKMYQLLVDMMLRYYDISTKRGQQTKSKQAENKQDWKDMQGMAEELITYLQIISEGKIVGREICAEMGANLQDIITKLDRHLK